MEQQEKKKTTAVHSLETVRKIRNIIRSNYSRAHEAKEQGRPVAYCMVACSYDEILMAMDITPVWTENYGGLCAAKRDAGRFISKAEEDGYSNVICGYVRSGIGFDAIRRELGEIPPEVPDGGMAEPDMLLGCSAGCDPRFKWYQALGHYKETPMYAFDTVIPPLSADLKEISNYYVKYQADQFRGLIEFLEKQTRKKMDYDKLRELMKISDETFKTWRDCYELRKASPCPMPSEDHFSAMVPAYFRLGTEEALNFYKELYAEVKNRVDNKIPVIPEEKYRLLWAGGLPPWHTLWTFNYFEDRGAVFCMEPMTSYRPWPAVDVPVKLEDDPIEYLAWRTFLRWTHFYDGAQKGSGNTAVQEVLDLVNDYKVDGMVMHATRSCRASTIGQKALGDLIQQYVNIPVLILVSDIVDLRDYSEAEWKSNIDGFMATVEARKEI